ncbi:MAG: glutamyl-tRNA reductase [Gaiellales bacterium]|jgi:glutamyl-tRNA reductase|nr:glutamyl-tRNA reductase [Gaiellales bacterium]
MADAVHLLLVGTNHRHAPIGVREQLASQAHGERLVEALIAEPAVIEAVGLSTCNRCELYMVGSDPEQMRAAALRRLATYASRSEEEVEPLLYVHKEGDAAEHLFAVAGGLDSLVPGEAQILAQIRAAYTHALERGSTGTVSNRLFHEAIEAGKRVRHETAIGEANASIASVAAELVREQLGSLDGVTVLIVGAGKVAELVAQNLASRGDVRIAVANRSPERARLLAERFDGTVAPFDRIAQAVAAARVIVCSTLSDGHVIEAGDVPPGPRVMVDLAVPRDIDPEAANIDGVTLVNVDDLEETVRRNIGLREEEAVDARRIVNEQATEFRSWLAALEVVPAITELRAFAEQIRVSELERMDGRWESLSDADRERLDQLTRTMLNKLLHRPTVRLKELAAENGDADHVAAVTELFGLRRAAS